MTGSGNLGELKQSSPAIRHIYWQVKFSGFFSRKLGSHLANSPRLISVGILISAKVLLNTVGSGGAENKKTDLSDC
ncbi:MAG: hypothetical protein ACLP7I_04385 [Limisphaerales bacterium]